MARFTQDHVNEWRDSGFTIIEQFFTADEIRPVLADFERIYGGIAAQEGIGVPKVMAGSESSDAVMRNRGMQFKNMEFLPYDGSVAFNLISLHPQLIAFAKALLGVDDVHLYQSHTWAKFTGEADYDQAFHCDFGNHTLTVPADDAAGRTVDFIFYLTDVTSAHGALRYVTKPDVREALGRDALAAPDADQQARLRARERAAEVPAGSLVAHGIDTMHRGSNLTAPGGRRFSMTVGYKAAGNDGIGYNVWQTGAGKPWELVLNNGSPEQLACLGIPAPGAAFWSERTLRLTQARWPDWDMTAWFEAADVTRAGPTAT